jgi:enoyl-CoA hydratase|tara:strand:- start:331 stop:1122 length:792 start_codon:yes stop_codon:yes gene_type:complete
MTELVTVETEGRTAIVRFDTGARANALSQQLMRDLTAAAIRFHDAPEISTVILTGRQDVFTMGADLKDPERQDPSEIPLSQRRIVQRAGPRLCEAWEKIDALTVCAIEGWCIGGGMALMASVDLRVASEAARFYVPEVERGMNMSWGSIPRFVALVGPARAKRMAALCEKVDAHTAESWGLVDYLAPPGEALIRAKALADDAASLPPTALKMVKQDVNVAAHALTRATGHRDLESFLLMQESEDFREGVASFLEGREPRFTGD